MTTRTLVWTLRISAALVVASTALPGCSSKVESGNGGTTKEDLFKCNLGAYCPETFLHIDVPQSPCAGYLVTSGKPGVLLATLTPGPYVDETQSLILLRGDGTAVLQNRERHCDGDDPPCPVPWEQPTVQQQCTVAISSGLAAACAAGGTGGAGGGPSGTCSWLPWGNLLNCTTIDELSCSDAKAILVQ
jgi:hypothetical protein